MDDGSRIGRGFQKIGRSVKEFGQGTKELAHGIIDFALRKPIRVTIDSDRETRFAEDDSNIKRPKNDSRISPSDNKQGISTCISIALVLKAKEARGLKYRSYLDQETVKQLLDDASYFLCVSEQEMADKWEELQCNEYIDYSSEQPIFVRIDLLHRGSLKKFTTKLELKRYLLESGTDFEYFGCVALIKPILIKELGFQRS